MDKDTDMEFRFGQMELSTKESGQRIKQTERASSGMQMGMFTKESGRTIRPTGLVFTFMLTEQGMKAIGKMISKMEQELKPGMMALSMKENTKKV